MIELSDKGTKIRLQRPLAARVLEFMNNRDLTLETFVSVAVVVLLGGIPQVANDPGKAAVPDKSTGPRHYVGKKTKLPVGNPPAASDGKRRMVSRNGPLVPTMPMEPLFTSPQVCLALGVSKSRLATDHESRELIACYRRDPEKRTRRYFPLSQVMAYANRIGVKLDIEKLGDPAVPFNVNGKLL